MKFDFDHTWLTSDCHLGHAKICEYCSRPYKSVADMDEDLVVQWNKVVSPNDTVYHLGDFTLSTISVAKKYFAQLNGTIHILNNFWHHDKRWIGRYIDCVTKNGSAVYLADAITVLEIDELGKDGYPLAVHLSHYPTAQWDRKHHGAWHCHGHSHNTYKAEGYILDVGVDSAAELLSAYRPFSLQEVTEIMKQKGWQNGT